MATVIRFFVLIIRTIIIFVAVQIMWRLALIVSNWLWNKTKVVVPTAIEKIKASAAARHARVEAAA